MRVAGFVLILCALPLLTGCGSDSGSEAERMAEEHEGDTPTATEAAQAPKIPVEGRTVTYGQQNGTARTGYLAAPADVDSVRSARAGDALPGIVVIHEWWGLNDNVRAATRRLAGEGYRALAVDLYGGAVAETPDSAQALMGQAMGEPSRLVENVRDGRAYLSSEADAARRFRDRMEDAGTSLAYHEYDAGHAFANPSGESYEPAAAEQAWTRTTDFLQTHLTR
ncbi:dienelactone hydrolase [Salinibacter ruber]|uniref:dienelactone hydrolase family protein n=1 Tax=Salinibacter ruber TaxID=146919 RepID=UPI002168A213|nr:dienelactone hydrolase family protein [Salinibacter ruber]MCS3632385.1 dienelactone hydrolase [Salinibacter ruber]MCS3829717.1 dienelactone hydrolase [Salinibacter ruber]MCS4050234.1 dienelactone hydrolase [Salinibacter ruber]MCS4056431.1 dienelactone hydrolase [Salinibacter ruber]MCS4060181.1 dienelactone hydrolase [Salinibacter ruber]